MGILGSILGFGKWVWRHTFGKRAYEEKLEQEEIRREEREEALDRAAYTLEEQRSFEEARRVTPDEISDEEIRQRYNEMRGMI